MKRILFVTALAAISCFTATAQNAASATPVEQQSHQYLKQEFSSKSNELLAVLSRGRQDEGFKVFSQIAGMMQKEIMVNNEKMKVAGEKEKTKIAATAEKQNALYREMKIMSVDLLKNQKEISEKLKEFQGTF